MNARKIRLLISVPALILLLLSTFYAVALAQLPGSNFEIEDGNTQVDGAAPSIDWDEPSISGDIILEGDEPSGQDDDSFGQGTKEDTEVPVVVSGSIPPNKSDLLEFGLYKEGSGGSGFLHLFWTRVQDPAGTTLMDFEINQNKCVIDSGTGQPTEDSLCSANDVTPLRSSGDLLVTYELTKGGKIPDLYLYEWLDGTEGASAADCQASNSLPCWGNEIDLDSAGLAEGSINDPDPISSTLLGKTYDPRTFGEASIDLSVIFDSSACESFGSAYLKSRSSDSFTAALKDFIAPVPIELSNCGTITVNKIVDPASSTDTFDFSVVGNTSYNFSLGHNGTNTNSAVLQGDYTITETDANTGGYDLVSVSCTKNGAAFTVSGNVPSFSIGIGDSVVCTFTNQARGTIIVEKTTAGDVGTFNFTSSTLGDFSLTTTAEGAAGADSQTFSGLVPGTFDVAEDLTGVTNWDLTSATCDDGSSPASISLGAGETVTCSFVNTKRGQIVIEKQTNPDNSTEDFEFSTSYYAANFTLMDGNQDTSGFLTPGSYDVSEIAESGWDLSGLSCSSDGGDSTTSQSGYDVQINLAAGETVTCVFTNTQRGAIVVEKISIGGADTFAFTSSTLGDGNFSLTTTEEGEVGKDSTTFNDLAPGGYDVGETQVADDAWDLTSASCDDDDGSDPASITLDPGETVTCTFTNTMRGVIIVAKQTNPDGASATFEFSGDLNGTIVDGGSIESGYIVAGTYQVTEADPAPLGYRLGSISCDDGDSTGDLLARTATFNLQPGETVTCTFVNSTGAILISKTTKDASAEGGVSPLPGVTFEVRDAANNLVATVVSDANGEACVPGLVASAYYTVTETAAPDGYDVSSVAPQTDTASYAECDGAGTPTLFAFVNTPLSEIEVIFRSLAGPGVTVASITCELDGAALTPTVEDLTPGELDDLDEIYTDLEPGTYSCTVVVDP